MLSWRAAFLVIIVNIARANCLSVFVLWFFPESGLTLCIDVNVALQCGIVVEVMNECSALAAEAED